MKPFPKLIRDGAIDHSGGDPYPTRITFVMSYCSWLCIVCLRVWTFPSVQHPCPIIVWHFWGYYALSIPTLVAMDKDLLLKLPKPPSFFPSVIRTVVFLYFYLTTHPTDYRYFNSSIFSTSSPFSLTRDGYYSLLFFTLVFNFYLYHTFLKSSTIQGHSALLILKSTPPITCLFSSVDILSM